MEPQDKKFRLKLLNLDPTQFENLIYDLLYEMGMHNLTWRSPGADGGRDIEGGVSSYDFSGQISIQKWYIECKRYSGSVDWPTIFGKVSYAKNHNADYLLMVTTSKFTPTAINETKLWNNREHLQIKLWPVNELFTKVKNYPNILAKYSLSDTHTSLKLPFLDLLEDIAKLLIAEEADQYLNADSELSTKVKLAKELSSLAWLRLWQLESEGKIFAAYSIKHREIPDGYSIDKEINPRIDNPGLTAFLYLWKFLTQQNTASICIAEDTCSFDSNVSSIKLESKKRLDAVAMWANMEYELNNNRVVIKQRAFPII